MSSCGFSGGAPKAQLQEVCPIANSLWGHGPFADVSSQNAESLPGTWRAGNQIPEGMGVNQHASVACWYMSLASIIKFNLPMLRVRLCRLWSNSSWYIHYAYMYRRKFFATWPRQAWSIRVKQLYNGKVIAYVAKPSCHCRIPRRPATIYIHIYRERYMFIEFIVLELEGL